MIDVQRRAQSPTSLARKRSYKGTDVLDALHKDFLGKCYLCETPVGWRCCEVDHRIPQSDVNSGGPALIYTWTNLFPTCKKESCNQRRSKTTPVGGWLSPGEGVEQRIYQWRSSRGKSCFVAVDKNDLAAVNCAAELTHLHDQLTPHGNDLRGAISEQLHEFNGLQLQMLELLLDGRPPTIQQVQDFKIFTNRNAPYFALVRSQVSPKLESFLEPASVPWLRP